MGSRAFAPCARRGHEVIFRRGGSPRRRKRPRSVERRLSSMRALAVGLVVGTIVLALEVWLAFSVWFLPTVADVANVAAFLVALVVLGLLARAERRRRRAAAVALALGVAMLD